MIEKFEKASHICCLNAYKLAIISILFKNIVERRGVIEAFGNYNGQLLFPFRSTGTELQH